MRIVKWLNQIVLVASVAALGGCRYGEVGGEVGSSAGDFKGQLDCRANEVREELNDGSCPGLRESKTHFKVVYTDGRTFFSYRAEWFRDNGQWLHGGSVVKAGTVAVKTGRRLTTADVIPEEKRGEAIARVREAVIAKIGGEANLLPSAEEVLAKLSENFYVGEDGLHFVFAEYSVAPYHYAPDIYGPVEVVIPAYGKCKMR